MIYVLHLFLFNEMTLLRAEAQLDCQQSFHSSHLGFSYHCYLSTCGCKTCYLTVMGLTIF